MLSALLAERERQGKPIRVGIIGAGKFGGGLVAQIAQMQGMVVSAIADIDLARARYAYTAGYGDVAVETADSPQASAEAIHAEKFTAIEDGLLVAQAENLDVIVEATGSTSVGASMASAAIASGNHLVMVNVETDVTIGALLKRKADSAGVVYSLVDGDQPGVTMNIIEWAWSLGLEVVAAGRGTILFADDPQGTPDNTAARFGFDEETLQRRNISLKMYNSFRDGTKAQVEATAIANMAGLVPDIRGMHEPSCNLADIPQKFSLVEEGGLLSQRGVIELANSVAEDGKTRLDNPLGMGVFVVVRSEHPFTIEDLATYDLHPGGDGKNFLLYRPYHLVAVEAPNHHRQSRTLRPANRCSALRAYSRCDRRSQARSQSRRDPRRRRWLYRLGAKRKSDRGAPRGAIAVRTVGWGRAQARRATRLRHRLRHGRFAGFARVATAARAGCHVRINQGRRRGKPPQKHPRQGMFCIHPRRPAP